MKHSFTRRTLLVLGLLLLAALFLYLLSRATLVFILTFVGILLSVLFRSLAQALPLPFRAALPVAVVLLLGVLMGFGWLLGPQLADQFQGLSEQLPQSTQQLEQRLSTTTWGQWLMENVPLLGTTNNATADSNAGVSLQALAATFSSFIGGLTGLLSLVAAALGHLFYVLFISIFFAAGADTYTSGAVKLVPPAHRERAREVLGQLYRTLQGWLLGQFVAMVTVGTLVGLGLWLLGIPFALGLGFITFLFEFIPTIGPWLAGVPAVLVALSQDFSAAL